MADKAKNAAIVPATLGTWLPKHTEGVTKPLIDGFVNTIRMTPGTNKIGAIGFCWGGRYAILEAHGQKKDGSGSSIGGVDAAVSCHPGLVAVPSDFDPVSVPLSLAVGTKDSLLDQKTVGQIQDLMAKKVDLPHELRVSLSRQNPLLRASTDKFIRSMRIRSTALLLGLIGPATKIRRRWMRVLSKGSNGSINIYHELRVVLLYEVDMNR